jgi:hypothetical protein
LNNACAKKYRILNREPAKEEEKLEDFSGSIIEEPLPNLEEREAMKTLPPLDRRILEYLLCGTASPNSLPIWVSATRPVEVIKNAVNPLIIKDRNFKIRNFLFYWQCLLQYCKKGKGLLSLDYCRP